LLAALEPCPHGVQHLPSFSNTGSSIGGCGVGPYCSFCGTFTEPFREADGNRAWNCAWRACAVCAPHRRTAHTAHPLIGVRGSGRSRGGAGWSANSGEPPTAPQDRTTPLPPAGGLSRYPTRTPSAVSGYVDTPTPGRLRVAAGAHGPCLPIIRSGPFLRWTLRGINRGPYAGTGVPPLAGRTIILAGYVLRGPVGRGLGPAFGRRRLRRQSEPALVATQGGATGAARRGQQPVRDVHGDAHRLTRFRDRR
jgi:hypothetical protein